MQGLVDEKSGIFNKPVLWWFQQDTLVYAMGVFSSNFMHFVTLVMSDLFLGQLLLRMVIGTVVLFSDPSICDLDERSQNIFRVVSTKTGSGQVVEAGFVCRIQPTNRERESLLSANNPRYCGPHHDIQPSWKDYIV